MKKTFIEKMIIIFVLLQPILDTITPLCLEYISPYLTLGIIVRTAFMGFIIIYSLIKTDKKTRTISLIYYILIAIYMCIFLVMAYNQNGTNMILDQIKGLFRSFYFPLVLVALYGLFNSNDIKIDNKYFIWTLAEYSLIIFIGKIFGFGYPTYKNGIRITGTVGLFFAANETGAILSLISPILCIEFLKDKKFNIINILTLALFIFSILEIGTRVPFLAFIMLFILFFIICIAKLFGKENRKSYIIKTIAVIGITVLLAFVVLYTPAGKNLVRRHGVKIVYENRLVPQLIFPKTLKGEASTRSELSVLTSGRDNLLKINVERYNQSTVFQKILGNSFLDNRNPELKINKLVEMDYFDILFSTGIVGFMLFFAPLIFILARDIIKTLKHFKQALQKEEIIIYWYTIVMALGIALMAGHTLTAPAVSIYIIFAILKLNTHLSELGESSK